MTVAPAVLVLGELLMDIVRVPGTAPVEHVGGSPANVARGLARLGHQVELATAVGDDERGRVCLAHLTESGVTVRPGSVTPAPTSVAEATLDGSGAATYRFDLHWDLAPISIGDPTGGHVHAGSIGATMSPGADEVTAAIVAARAAGWTVSYDPNIRPSIMGAPNALRVRVEELVARSDVVKASEDDVSFLYAADTVDEVMHQWCSLGAAVTVVTLGAAGVTWRIGTSGAHGTAPTHAARVVDTVGAGDSFMAGLLSGMLDADLLGSSDAREALAGGDVDFVGPIDRALATSGITVSHAGAYSPTRAELNDPEDP